MRRLAYIDALRGYAILGVIAVHASQYFPNLNWTVGQLVEEGARGVQLFFVASALSLMFSWHDRNDGATAFYIRRVFRIAPMFWVAIGFFLLAAGGGPGAWAPHGIGWAQIASSIALVHGFHPETLDAIVPVALVISLIFASRFFDFAVPILLAVMPEEDPALLKAFSYLWFPNQLPSFMTGILVFQLLREQKQPLGCGAVRIGLVVSVTLMLVLPFTFVSFRSFPAYLYMLLNIQLQMVYALVFGLFTFCLAQRPNILLVNPAIRYIGKVSYSAYFLHFAVITVGQRVGVDLSGLAHQDIYFVFVFMAVAALSIAGAAVTYRYIEVPMINVGAKLLRAMSKAKELSEAQPVSVS